MAWITLNVKQMMTGDSYFGSLAISKKKEILCKMPDAFNCMFTAMFTLLKALDV